MELGKLLVNTRCICLVSVPVSGFTTGCTPREQFVRLVGSGRCWNEHLLWYPVGSRRFDFRTFHALSGVALGQSISLGTCAGFGTLLPALFAGTNLFEGNGLILLLGVCITLAGIAIIGYAGSLRAQNMSEEEKRAAVKDFALTKGLLVALLAGVMSACFALGLDAGTPIKEAALAGGVEGLYAGLPVIFLVTFGGFLTNAVYCLQQNVANKSMGDYAKGKVWGNNLVFCALAGVLWYMQFFGLEMGKSFLTESPVLLAFSWCILMALNVTFSNVWGIILKEWKGVSNKTITVLIAGLIVLIFSLVFPNLF